MADEQPTNQPGGADDDSTFEQDLDDALSEATSLVGSLTDEVGEAETTTDAQAGSLGAESTAEPPSDLDAELGALEDLLASTSSEIDVSPDEAEAPAEEPQPAEEAETAEPPSPELDEPAASSLEQTPESEPAPEPDEAPTEAAPTTPPAVPDFMNEFTQPAEAPEVDLSEPSPPTPPAKPGVVGSPIPRRPAPGIVGTGVVGTPDSSELTSKSDLGSLAALDEADLDLSEEEAEDAEEVKKRPRANPLRTVAKHASPLALTASEGVVSLLELLDRPVSGLSHTFRRVVGWLALAMFSLTIIVFLLSLR